ncbi:MAG: hypothetical protein ACOX5F_10585 [Anaerovoracaceae bacterium]|jgi:hypothetical protein
MSNTMKLLARILIILLLMVIGAWLNAQLSQAAGLGPLSNIIIYAVYLLIGITAGSAVNPRFTKPKNKGLYIIPVLIFAIIGAQWFFYPIFPVTAIPLGIGSYLMQFSNLSWSLAGIFLNLAFR